MFRNHPNNTRILTLKDNVIVLSRSVQNANHCRVYLDGCYRAEIICIENRWSIRNHSRLPEEIFTELNKLCSSVNTCD